MSLPRRPKGEYRRAQHEGSPVSPVRPAEGANARESGPRAASKVHP